MASIYSCFKETTSNAINIFKPKSLEEYALCAIPCALAMVSSAGAMIASACYLGYKWKNAQPLLPKQDEIYLQPASPEKNPSNFYVKRARRALVELAAIAVSMSVCLPFARERDIPFIIGFPLVHQALSIGAEVWLYRKSKDPNLNQETKDLLFKETPLPWGGSFTGRGLAKALCFLWSGLSGQDLLTLIHETGHALGNRICYSEMPTIKLIAGGGLCFIERIFDPSTEVGQMLGKKHCEELATFSGPALGLLAASATLIAARSLKAAFPVQEAKHLARFLRTSAHTHYLIGLLYAFSGFFADPRDKGHDFGYLSNAGIPIPAAIIFITAMWILSSQPSVRDKKINS